MLDPQQAMVNELERDGWKVFRKCFGYVVMATYQDGNFTDWVKVTANGEVTDTVTAKEKVYKLRKKKEAA